MTAPEGSAPPKAVNVLQDLLAKLEELRAEMAPYDADAPKSTPSPEVAMRRVTELGLVMSTCAVHGLGLLAEIAQYQRVLAETATITLQMKQMQQRPLQIPPGIKLG